MGTNQQETLEQESSGQPGHPRRPRVAVFPYGRSANPYQDLLHDALRSQGVEILPPTPLTLRWALRTGRRVDVVHLHWIEWLIRSRSFHPLIGRLDTIARTARLFFVLVLLRTSGVRVVLTVHNLQPHELRYPRFEPVVMRGVARLAHVLVAHSDYAARRIRAEYSVTCPVIVAHHGNFTGVYPPEQSPRSDARARLGIPAAGFVYLAFGCVRAYKQIPAILEAFRQLEDPDSRLIIAGEPHASEIATVEAAAKRDSRVILHLRNIPVEEVATLHAVSDAAIFNYREMFSSGAILLALSQGLPTVAPEGSMADDIAAPPALVTFRPGMLTNALLEIQAGDQAARRRAALVQASWYPWSRTAEEHMAAYGLDFTNSLAGVP